MGVLLHLRPILLSEYFYLEKLGTMFAKTMEANMRPCVRLTRDLDLKEIKALESATNDVRERRRLIAIRLCSQGYKTPEICKILGVTKSSVQRWVTKFNSGGLEALRSRKPPGKARWLTDEQIEVVCGWLDSGPEEHHGCQFWTGGKLLKAIEDEFGVRYKLKGIYKMLRYLGYRRIVPKTRHYRSDPKAGEEFKKNSPLWSRR